MVGKLELGEDVDQKAVMGKDVVGLDVEGNHFVGKVVMRNEFEGNIALARKKLVIKVLVGMWRGVVMRKPFLLVNLQ